MTRYAKPTTVDDALALLGEGRWRVLAGGTDFYPALGSAPLREDVLDIKGLSGLRGIAETATHLVIGALTTWSDLVAAELPPSLAALQHAAREVGSVQIQNVATIAGNLCNASPAADGVPALLVVEAEVELRSVGAGRHLALGEFLRGNRQTARRPDELVTAIRLPKSALGGASAFFKLGARRYLVISIAMTAARIAVGADNEIEGAAIAVGACSAVARRLPALEAALVGRSADRPLAALVDPEHLAPLAPLDDVRGSAAYRLEAAREIVGRSIEAAAARARRAAGPATVAA